MVAINNIFLNRDDLMSIMDAYPPDKPVSNLENDRLHRKELVQMICKIIQNQDVSNSYTIGIIGKWGSGKTSIINFIKEELKEKGKKKENRTPIEFIDFNPWIYSSQENLSQEFLHRMSYVFGKKISKISKFFSRIRCLLKKFNISKIEVNVLVWKLSIIIEQNETDVSIQDLKEIISKKLQKSETRYVVIMDDIDRLDSHEVRMVFKLVRSIADFSNVIYILGYDDQIISKMMDTPEYSGKNYLQKIINLPIRLPEISKDILANSLVEKYTSIISISELSKLEDKIIYGPVKNHLDSLRDINYLTSKFGMKYEISKHNTCPIDLLCLSLLEIKEPVIYWWISENRYLLSDKNIWYRKYGFKDIKGKIYEKYQNDGMNEEYSDILSCMFPEWGSYASNFAKYKTGYRIDNLMYIDNYFLITPSSLDITDEDINDFIKIENNDEMKSYVENNEDRMDIGSLVFRALNIISNSPDLNDNLKTLSDAILIHNQGSTQMIPIKFVELLCPIPTAYVNQLSGQDLIKYLQSTKKSSDIKGTIFNAKIITRILILHRMKISDAEIDLFCNNLKMILEKYYQNYNEILDHYECFMFLYLVDIVDEDSVKHIFIEKFNKIERIELYDEFHERGMDYSWLAGIAGDEYL